LKLIKIVLGIPSTNSMGTSPVSEPNNRVFFHVPLMIDSRRQNEITR